MRSALRLTAFVAIWVFAPASTKARVIFAEKQVLTPAKTVELTVWRADSSASDSGWSCDSLGASAFRVGNCLVKPYARGSTVRERYLYWAFLNLAPASRRGDLAPREKELEEAFDSLQQPLLALKQRGDSCSYLVLYRDSYAPLAAGRVACRDLPEGLAGIDADMAGRTGLVPRAWDDKSGKRVMRPGELDFDTPNVIDYGLEVSAAAAFQINTDETEEAGPYSTTKKAFDFGDFAEVDVPPLSVRVFLMYGGVVGLRGGYAYSRFSLTTDAYNAFKTSVTGQGGTLQDFTIDRHDYSGELLLGRTIGMDNAEWGIHGVLGMVRVDYRESAKIDGKTYRDLKDLKDETGAVLGFGSDIRMANHVAIGFEAALLMKSFEFQGSGSQPDGTGNELQLRLRLAGFNRIFLGNR